MSDTLTLSGWVQPADAIAKQLPNGAFTFDYSDYPSPEASFEGLKQFANVPYIIGWSMGGQLAMRAILAGVLKPKHLTLIGTPHKFVSHYGMDSFTFDNFRGNYVADPVRSKQKFLRLIAKGDKDAERVMNALTYHPDIENTARWVPWLDALAAYTLGDATFNVPTLIIQGEHDAIVPHGQGLKLLETLPNAEFSEWRGVSHAPHVHDANRLWREITEHRKKAGV